MIRFLITSLSFLIISNSFSQSIDVESWTKDIDFYKTNLEKHHIDLYNNISKVEFEQELKKIKLNL